MSGPPRPFPTGTDPDSAGYFEATAAGRLVVRRCDDCGAVSQLPGSSCPQWGGRSGSWTPVEGRGGLYSWTTVHHQVHPAFPVPYNNVLVEFDDPPGVRFGHLPGEPKLRMPVRVRFDDAGDGLAIPGWEPHLDQQESTA